MIVFKVVKLFSKCFLFSLDCLLYFINCYLVACICKISNVKSSAENHRLTELDGVKYKNEGPRIKKARKEN